MEDVASTSMKLDFTLFKGASIRFHDVGNASTQAAQLRGKTPAIKNSTCCASRPPKRRGENITLALSLSKSLSLSLSLTLLKLR